MVYAARARTTDRAQTEYLFSSSTVSPHVLEVWIIPGGSKLFGLAASEILQIKTRTTTSTCNTVAFDSGTIAANNKTTIG